MSKPTILITGCSSGIGAHCARALHDDGWRVFATARKDEDIKALQDDGFETFYLDYAKPESIKALFVDVMKKTENHLDALFNNGAYSQAGAVEDLPVEALREQFDANFFGWHELTKMIVPIMRQQKSGRIIHCSSILGITPMRWRGAYNASKFALEGLMLTLRMEVADAGIHVSMIEPGPIESKIASNAMPYIEKYIDMENSVHAEDYEKQMQRLRQGGTKSWTKLGPDAVYKVLKHALYAKKPRPHYAVTFPAKLGMVLRRILPSSFFYGFLSSQS